MADNLATGRKIRLLTIVDNYSRECVALEVATGFNGSDVAGVLSRCSRERGAPRFIRCDNGSEFVSKAVDQWAYSNKVEIDFSHQESRRTTHCANHSTAGCAKNCSTLVGSNHLPTHKRNWPNGERNTTTIGRTDLCRT